MPGWNGSKWPCRINVVSERRVRRTTLAGSARHRFALRSLLLLALLLVGTAAWGDADVATPAPDAARPVTAAELGFDHLRGVDAVRATRHGNLLVLDGTVNSIEDRELVERLARVNGDAEDVLNRVDVGVATYDGLVPALQLNLDKLTRLFAMLPMLLVAALALWLVWRLGRWLSNRTWIGRVTSNPLAGELVKQAIRVAAVVLGLLVALEILGATSLAAAVLGSAGIAGIAVGFAFRDLLENYIAGVLLSIRQPFAPDDVIQLEGREGVVVGMNSRATMLMTHDGNHLTLPNAIVFKAVILNLSRNGNRRFDFFVDLNPQIDLAAALRVGLEAIASTPGVLATPKPFVQLNELGRDVARLQCFAWVDQRNADFGLARSEALRRARTALSGIGAYFGPPQLQLVAAQTEVAIPREQHPTVATTPAAAPANEQRRAVDEAIEKTRSEMGSTDLLRSHRLRE
jgi:small conductance mechanosensitive channel